MTQLQKIQELALKNTPEGKENLANEIIRFYLGDSDNPDFLSNVEKDLLLDIVLRLFENAKKQIRMQLSDKLAREISVPKELILKLANDEIDVADPVLTQSSLLHDSDLKHIANTKGPKYQYSIAGREEISEGLAESLIEAGDTEAVKRLLNNKGAKISETGMEKAALLSQEHASLQESFLKRPEINNNLAAKIYYFASEALKTSIKNQYQIDEAVLNQALTSSIENLTLFSHSDAPISDKQKDIAKRLYETGTLTTTVLITILKRGYINLFKYLLELMSKLTDKSIQKMIYKYKLGTFALLCKGLGFKHKDFATIILLLHPYRKAAKEIDQIEYKTTNEFFQTLDMKIARLLLKKWREDPSAIHDYSPEVNLNDMLKGS